MVSSRYRILLQSRERRQGENFVSQLSIFITVLSYLSYYCIPSRISKIMSNYNILSRDFCHVFYLNGTEFCILHFRMTAPFFWWLNFILLIGLFIFYLDILWEYLLEYISYFCNDVCYWFNKLFYFLIISISVLQKNRTKGDYVYIYICMHMYVSIMYVCACKYLYLSIYRERLRFIVRNWLMYLWKLKRPKICSQPVRDSGELIGSESEGLSTQRAD